MTSETVEVARIALRLPPFWKSNVRLWIAQCDHAFTFSVILSDDTKYSALVANLDAETLSYVSDIVLSPPNSDKYHTLSQRLITQFSDSETQKIKKLLTDLQLDEKPSHLLRKIKELSNGQLQDDFLQKPLDKLAIIADKVSEVVGASSTICAATTVPPPSQSSSCSAQPTMDSLARQIQELSLQVAELTRERNSSRHQRYSFDRRRSHSRSRSVNRGSGICYYHRRYKEQARKCVSPCAKKRVSSVIAGMAEPSQHTSRLFLLDRKSGQKFLIDSGCEICVIPLSPTMNKSPQSNFSLFAANNTKIPAYGMVRKELNLGLRRPFIWTFIIADVSSPIICADFLKHFNLLIDLKKKRRFLPKPAEQRYLLSEFLKGSKGKKDSKPLNWSSEAITAFQRCKQALADAALLAHPSPSAPLALHVDASDYAIGGALHQVVDSELQPLAFFSRKLTSSEKSYSAYDRELLAIYSAIRHFRYMLEARDFTVFTDHKPLTYAFRQKSDKCSPRQIRQPDFISQFTTNIVHIPGSVNIAADVLSRVSAITFPSQIDYDCIAETQQTDQELHTLIASGTSLELKKVTFPNSSTEIMCDLSTGTARPYIPKQNRQDVFSAMHNLSHPGIRRSVHLMKQRFVWPSITSDVAKWARHCLAYQKYKFIVILDHLFHHFKNLPNVLIMFIWISLDLYLHQMATPIA
ncbi:transposon Tf2-11 polyprotein [Trichonephila clavipes]|nr:transposon Tf2-11 polyprotein [Trichonephila clavipes]